MIFKGIVPHRRTVHFPVTKNSFSNNQDIAKKKKDTSIVSNRRPILDYKMATKCIAKRLGKVLPFLIAKDY